MARDYGNRFLHEPAPDNRLPEHVDHAEYPQTAEVEQRCIRRLADLVHAPGETTGTRTQESSEPVMLGAGC